MYSNIQYSIYSRHSFNNKYGNVKFYQLDGSSDTMTKLLATRSVYLTHFYLYFFNLADSVRSGHFCAQIPVRLTSQRRLSTNTKTPMRVYSVYTLVIILLIFHCNFSCFIRYDKKVPIFHYFLRLESEWIQWVLILSGFLLNPEETH